MDAVRDQVDYVLILDIPGASYYVITSDMTPEKKDEIKKKCKKISGRRCRSGCHQPEK